MPDYLDSIKRKWEQDRQDKKDADNLAVKQQLVEIGEKEHQINLRRDWRERWLFVFAIGSLLVSVASLWIAGLALKVACLPK